MGSVRRTLTVRFELSYTIRQRHADGGRMSIADLINARLGAMGLGAPDLRRALERRGVDITRQSIHAWLHGVTRPTPANVLVLWDVLVVPIEEREAWMAALALPALALADHDHTPEAA